MISGLLDDLGAVRGGVLLAAAEVVPGSAAEAVCGISQTKGKDVAKAIMNVRQLCMDLAASDSANGLLALLSHGRDE